MNAKDKKQYDKFIALGYTHEEAIELIEYDKMVDRGEIKDTPEEKEVRKQLLKAERKKTERKPKERKIDNEKLEIFNLLKETLKNNTCEITGFSNEREIEFNYNNKAMKIVLSLPRKKKE